MSINYVDIKCEIKMYRLNNKNSVFITVSHFRFNAFIIIIRDDAKQCFKFIFAQFG